MSLDFTVYLLYIWQRVTIASMSLDLTVLYFLYIWDIPVTTVILSGWVYCCVRHNYCLCFLFISGNQEEALPMWITRPKTRESNDSVWLDCGRHLSLCSVPSTTPLLCACACSETLRLLNMKNRLYPIQNKTESQKSNLKSQNCFKTSNFIQKLWSF